MTDNSYFVDVDEVDLHGRGRARRRGRQRRARAPASGGGTSRRGRVEGQLVDVEPGDRARRAEHDVIARAQGDPGRVGAARRHGQPSPASAPAVEPVSETDTGWPSMVRRFERHAPEMAGAAGPTVGAGDAQLRDAEREGDRGGRALERVVPLSARDARRSP